LSTVKPRAREINDTIRYTMWSVFEQIDRLPDDRTQLQAELHSFFTDLEALGVATRGWYDLRGMRASADLMIWWHAEKVEALQAAYGRFLNSALGDYFAPHWSSAGVHRPAEFNRGHTPAFMRDEPAGAYVCVYPFVRSYEWYLLPEEERRALLVEHGVAGRKYPEVLANTVASFALGDYEWLLAFEGPQLHDIVDLMRDLRSTAARRHVREEIPFFTGPLITPEVFLAGR
jgi:chlorite dismutase